MIEKLTSLFEPGLVAELEATGNLRSFHEGDIIMDYGKYINSMPVILSGNVRVLTQDEEGNEILLYYLSSNESCAMAYTCCMDAKQSEVKAVAEDDVTLVTIPQKVMDEWLCKYPSWRTYIMHSFTARFNELLASFESIAFKKLDERLVKYLTDRQKISGSSIVKASHQQIADDLATSRVVISRLLKHLENEKKLILYRNEIKLLKAINM
ncbi:MAG TPA: Crp/Fnr family transcriptional regulator [Saprospiraceae bacterium]|nr:Crp/Fnr family transcriptional regulator [Saprospiraceae bacterium]MCC6688012.1 Crp/Fnr family transcriptional regulator [Saprospiraceae bacterium]HMV23067.1 Crp/Fnr family transcriptional regulator [Saprospiraceae bacterium]HMX82239.1 Crp/Fnr family transcriptional regulator [Saprospiraceae bacterium]HMX86274.1 Crp/Fnr family transcriptional regulator [Saprospiraceae bacterium]